MRLLNTQQSTRHVYACRLISDLAQREVEERKKNEIDRVRVVMSTNPIFARIVSDHPALEKYIETHPNLTKAQMRDLLDRRPEFVAAFDAHPEELMRIGRAPALRLMLDKHPDLKAALDKKNEVSTTGSLTCHALQASSKHVRSEMHAHRPCRDDFIAGTQDSRVQARSNTKRAQ